MTKKTRQELLEVEQIEIEGYNFVNDDNKEPILLGEGGSGIVYKVEQQFVPTAKCDRAIKFFVFKDELISRLDTYVSSLNFEDEIVNISKFNHQNVLKIIDGGYISKEEINIPYIVSDFVKGETLENVVSDKVLIEKHNLKSDQIINLFQQVVDGMVYLHNRNFYHCDIAPKNIFINVNHEGLHAIIGDLGVGHTLTKEDSKKEYLVTGTRAYMPDEVQKRKDDKVSFTEFRALQPNWDLFSLQLSFKECLHKVFEVVDGEKTDFIWLNALLRVLNKDYTNVSDLRKAMERVKPIHRTIANLPELSETDSKTWKKLMPLNDILMTKRIKKVTKHPCLLRLKRVPQLLMGSSIFPGSNHTRYEHQLGTYENMRRVLLGLLKKEKFIVMLSEEYLELALVSSLLSNITRFPYSFAIHEIRNSDKSILPKINQRDLFDILIDYKDDKPNFKFSIRDTLDKHFSRSDLKIIKDIICGPHDGFNQPEIQFISSLLNSSVDVRVLDFLQRDPHHLGMTNGFQFDLENLISFLDISNNKVAIKSQGVSYVEQVISSRYWLYKNIYWNEPNRSYTAMLKQIIHELIETKNFEEELLNQFMFTSSSRMIEFFEKKAKGNDLAIDLIGLLKSNRPRNFKRIFLINKSEEESTLSGICDKISKIKFSELNALRTELEKELKLIYGFDDSRINILIDIPTDENTKLGKDLNVIRYDGKPTKLTKLSGIVDGINNYFDSHLQWLRIYIHPNYKKMIRDKQSESSKVIKEFLIRKLG